MPNYKKKLWDDTDSFIKAPSAADLTSMAISVLTVGAGGALVEGANIAAALATAAINLSDDLALSAMNIGTGERTFAEGAFDFAKTAARLDAYGGDRRSVRQYRYEQNEYWRAGSN